MKGEWKVPSQQVPSLHALLCDVSLKHRLEPEPALPVLQGPVLTHLQLLQVGGRLPVLVVADAGAAREADGDPVRSVGLGLGELGPGDLPHGGFLNTAGRKPRHVPLVSQEAAPKCLSPARSPPQHSFIYTN